MDLMLQQTFEQFKLDKMKLEFSCIVFDRTGRAYDLLSEAQNDRLKIRSQCGKAHNKPYAVGLTKVEITEPAQVEKSLSNLKALGVFHQFGMKITTLNIFELTTLVGNRVGRRTLKLIDLEYRSRKQVKIIPEAGAGGNYN